MAAKNSKSIYIAAFGLLLAGLGFLIYSGLSENSMYFLNVSEALAMEPAKLNAARLFGTVDEQGLERPDSGAGVTFRLVDKDDASKAIVVDYKGAVPDTFKPGAEVIVEGRLRDGREVFSATTLMTKCPSKYQKENREG
jgi:cytochrome c-type biogenesis protein CcmE